MTNFVVSIFLCANLALCNAACGQLFDNIVTEGDKELIANIHNFLRKQISQGKVSDQPKGTNLQTLEWDDELAAEAQNIANTCEFKHVKVIDGRFYVGQNLYRARSGAKTAGADWQFVIQCWFDEYKNFKYPTTSTGVTGHYTQVVWAVTQYIGCGFTSYHKNDGERYEKLYVCNYGPGGNYRNQPPYKI